MFDATKAGRGAANTIQILSVLALLAIPMTAIAGPVVDFERSLRSAYADYRAALFQTNAGNAEATRQALTAFSTKWAALAAAYASPPPQYADDASFASTLTKVTALLGQADQETRNGRLTEAHEVLERVRDEIGGLHLRNGIIGFSDRMNAFHEHMEHVLGTKVDAVALGNLREQVAVLVYLADELKKHPAPEAQTPDYAPTFQNLSGAIDTLQKAVRAGDVEAAKAAMGKIKPAYARMFAKFG